MRNVFFCRSCCLLCVWCIWNFHLLLRWELCWQNLKLNCICSPWSWRTVIWCQDEVICNLLSSLAFDGVWQSAILMPAGVRAGWGYSTGIQQVSVGYSGVSWGSVSRELGPCSHCENNSMQTCIRTLEHTHTHTHECLEDLPESLFKLTQVSWYPRATPPQPPAPPPFFFFSNRLCWKEPIVRWLVTRHPIYQ